MNSTFNEAVTAYQQQGGELEIDPFTSHYEPALECWFLISNRTLVATYCQRKLEII